MESPAPDLAQRLLKLPREAFVAECPFPVLLAANEVSVLDALANDETSMGLADAQPATSRPMRGVPLVAAVRPLHSTIPHAILVGRAPNADILLIDSQISKIHALFHNEGEAWQLSDAGSRNGTWVGNDQLRAKGRPRALVVGDILSFGHRAFFFLDAGGCWDRVTQAAAFR